MKTYTFLTEKNTFETVYLAIPSDKIKKMRVADTYDSYGNEVEDYDESDAMCEGFNFHNGCNWQSVIVNYEDGDDCHYEVVEDENLCKELNEAIENAVYISECSGVKTFETEEYIIEQSLHASAFETYSVREK